MFLLTNLNSFAQFYDSDQEVRIYISEKYLSNPSFGEGIGVAGRVFNFNGETAAFFRLNDRYCEMLLEDENAFEKLIYGNNIDLIEYIRSKSNSEITVYNKKTWPNTSALVFSKDGKYYYASYFTSTDRFQSTYVLISKKDFIELLLKRTNIKYQRWR